MDVTERNIKTIAQMVTTVQEENEEFRLRITKLENNLVLLGHELTNTKQLLGHLSGRGTGPTT